jgi:hypothetical protein
VGTVAAGAEAAVRQPSKPASGRGDACQGGDSPAIPALEATMGLDQGSGDATAAQRLSSTDFIRHKQGELLDWGMPPGAGPAAC